MIVYTQHISGHYYRDFISNPYGAEPAESNHGISQLPIVRVIYAGKGMVAIFFVLSGFVLTYSPLRKIANPSRTSTDELITGLCSSILRRGVRLFAPMIVLAVMSCLMTWHYPAFYPGNWRESNPTFLQHMWRYVQITLPVFNPFRWDIYHPLSFNQCWTLAVEYRGSMVVFLMCVATARLTTRARKLVVLSSALWALHWGRGDMFTFLSGMFLAELRYCPLSEDFTFMGKCRIPWRVTYALSTCLLLLSLLIIGWPENGDVGVEPFKTLAQFIPNAWRVNNEWITFFWSYVGAAGLLTAVENLPPAQWLLSTTPILYLGEISYAFYLLHWMAFLWPGWNMMVYFVNVLQWPHDLSFYIMFVLTLALLIVVADYFWRTVDEGCVRMGKTFVEWLGVHNSPSPVDGLHHNACGPPAES
jgi:peptidoglycan/LPS O-acetylase OafA/YrhL